MPAPLGVVSAPSPVCQITATATQLSPLKLVVHQMAPARSSNTSSCNSTYAHQLQSSTEIYFSPATASSTLSVGQPFTSLVHYGGDERQHGYFLTQISPLATPASPAPTLLSPSFSLFILAFFIVFMSSVALLLLYPFPSSPKTPTS